MFSLCSHGKDDENIRASYTAWDAGAIPLQEMQQGCKLHRWQSSSASEKAMPAVGT